MSGFTNRSAAGQALAKALAERNFDKPLVLALPRGGVPVAVEVASKLGAPLDLVMVRKIGVPFQPELAAAAVVNGAHPEIVVNESIAAMAGLTQEDIEGLADTQLQEIKRRRGIYMKGRTQVPIDGKSAIIVDDGIATGATVRAAIKAVRRQNPSLLVLAVPVAPADTLSDLRPDVDEIICLETPEPFYAIGGHYLDFAQVEDEEVVRLLAEAAKIVSDKAAQETHPTSNQG